MISPAILLLLYSLINNCSSNCWRARPDSPQNSTGPTFLALPGPLTGFVTVKARFNNNAWTVTSDYLRFVIEEEGFEPLVMKIHSSDRSRGKIMMFAEERSRLVPNTILNEDAVFPKDDIFFQISDRKVFEYEAYELFLGDPEAESDPLYLKFNYQGANIWEDRSGRRLNKHNYHEEENLFGMRLRRATTVKRDNTAVSLEYVSVCEDPSPKLCVCNATESVVVELGKEYSVSCAVSGAPYLVIEWEVDFEAEEYLVEERRNDTGSDDYLESVLTISAFTLDHIGSVSCKARNFNFESPIQKKDFHFTYISLSPRMDIAEEIEYDAGHLDEDGNETKVLTVDLKFNQREVVMIVSKVALPVNSTLNCTDSKGLLRATRVQPQQNTTDPSLVELHYILGFHLTKWKVVTTNVTCTLELEGAQAVQTFLVELPEAKIVKFKINLTPFYWLLGIFITLSILSCFDRT